MIRYRVEFMPEARDEALDASDYIAETSPLNAARWYEGLEQALERLRTFPKRCAVAPESQFLGEELRHYIYKSHRIIFRVETRERIVRVLHVRHVRRRAIGEE